MSIQDIIKHPVNSNLNDVTVALLHLGDLKTSRNGNTHFYKANVAYTLPHQSSHQFELTIWSGDELGPTIIQNPGQLINIKSLKISEYQNTKSYSADAKNIAPVLNQTRDQYLQMIPHSYWTTKQLTQYFKTYSDQITNPNYHAIVNACYRQVNDLLTDHDINLFEMPAAVSMHHAFVGGLLTHTISMLKIASSILDNTIYSQYFDRSLIYSGIFLHDLGKALCYTNALDHQESTPGTLFDHIEIIDSILTSVAQDYYHENQFELLDNREFVKLRQLILSHHGKLEWGSPVQPKIPEAIFVHYIDNVDAHLEMIREILDDPQIDSQGFTDKIFGLNNTKLWLPDQLDKSKNSNNN